MENEVKKKSLVIRQVINLHLQNLVNALPTTRYLLYSTGTGRDHAVGSAYPALQVKPRSSGYLAWETLGMPEWNTLFSSEQ